MPTYRYRCEEGHEFEEWQKITEEPLKKCKIDKCKAKVKRQINFQGGIIKVGSGWTPKFH